MEDSQTLKSAIDGKYIYKGRDISFEVVETIADTVKILSKNESRSFDDVYTDFMNSQVYKALTDTKSGLWMENAEFIADEYEREKISKTI
jgi:hypothetical protein